MTVFFFLFRHNKKQIFLINGHAVKGTFMNLNFDLCFGYRFLSPFIKVYYYFLNIFCVLQHFAFVIFFS